MSLQWQSTANKPPRTVPATELKNRLGAVIQSAIQNKREVIISSRGVPTVAIIPFDDWERLADMKHKQEQEAERKKALETWKSLRAQVRARNQDLTEDQAQALANRFSRDVIAAVIEKRKQKYG